MLDLNCSNTELSLTSDSVPLKNKPRMGSLIRLLQKRESVVMVEAEFGDSTSLSSLPGRGQ